MLVEGRACGACDWEFKRRKCVRFIWKNITALVHPDVSFRKKNRISPCEITDKPGKLNTTKSGLYVPIEETFGRGSHSHNLLESIRIRIHTQLVNFRP